MRNLLVPLLSAGSGEILLGKGISWKNKSLRALILGESVCGVLHVTLWWCPGLFSRCRPNTSAVKQVPVQGGKKPHKIWTGLHNDENQLRIWSVCLKARLLSVLFGVIEISDLFGVGVCYLPA